VLLQDQPATKRYRVILHFAELREVAKNECLFDIQMQGKTVLKGFDPVAAAGGRNRAVTRLFTGIEAERALDIRFVSPGDGAKQPPVLSAVEVLLDK